MLLQLKSTGANGFVGGGPLSNGGWDPTDKYYPILSLINSLEIYLRQLLGSPSGSYSKSPTVLSNLIMHLCSGFRLPCSPTSFDPASWFTLLNKECMLKPLFQSLFSGELG